ncbi:site-specific integrase [Cloacibacillus sp. An23]|uniref:site-specific integrase n=1 Tax=Cloacibacillus sp. An23 TaxID=1965591 RepID=UPI000B3983D2|nr:site-specific integrase [Cloacibacillus sp. An23]OUO94845.1 site-specific integrase [Cloacibacillus sp. An23]
MELVEPIRDMKKLEKMKKYLKGKNLRDYCLFVLGINSGLRVSDLLNLKIDDVADKGKLKDRIHLIEQKTGKTKDFPISDTAAKAIKEYLGELNDDTGSDYLFQSRKGKKAISRIQAWRILNEAAAHAGLEKDSIGTHTMRKTFGYHAYKKGMDITIIQKLLNHSSPSITLSYIGITRDDLDNVYLNLNL